VELTRDGDPDGRADKGSGVCLNFFEQLSFVRRSYSSLAGSLPIGLPHQHTERCAECHAWCAAHMQRIQRVTFRWGVEGERKSREADDR